MRTRFFLIVALTLSLGASQTHAQVSKSTLNAQTSTAFPDNNSGAITPATTRTYLNSVIASFQQYAGVNPQVGTSYTIQQSDYGQLVTFNNASAVAVTLPAASSAGFSPFSFYVADSGAGTVTITPSLGTINGAASFQVAQSQSIFIVSDGTNWQIVKGFGTGIVATANAPLSISGSAISLNKDSNFAVNGSNQLALSSVLTQANVVAPSTPASGFTSLYVDSTQKVLTALNDAGSKSITVVSSSAPSNQFATGLSAAGVLSYAQPTIGNLANVTGLSVVGVTGSSSATPAAITGTASQFLGVNAAATALAFQTMAGDATLSGPTITLGANVVTYAKFQQVAASSLVGNPTGSLANAQGITLGATLAFSGTALQTGAMTGDITTSANSFATTLATVNANVGSFGSSTAIPNFTVNAKGLITAAGTNAVIAPAGTLTGTTLASNVVTTSITSVGASLTYGSGPAILTSPSAAVMQLGAANANPAVAQTLQAQSATGTNIAGQNFTIIGSLSTGTATDGDMIFQVGVKNGLSGSTPGLATTALTLKAETLQANFAFNLQLPNAGVFLPASDSTTALFVANAANSHKLVIYDTTNERVGINKTPGAFDLDVNGAANVGGVLTFGTLSSTSLGASTSTITGLTTNNSPVTGSDFVPYYCSANGAICKITVASLTAAGVAGVSSLNGLTGGLSVVQGSGITVGAVGSSVTVTLNLNSPNVWDVAQTFPASGIKLAGSSTGLTTFVSANSGASNFTMTFPAVTDTLAVLNTAQSFTAVETFTGQAVFNIANTITSSTGANLDDVKVQAATTTITGNTGSPITKLNKVAIYAPLITGASAVTVTDAAAFYAEAPTSGGSVTLTNAWAFRAGTGNMSLASGSYFIGSTSVLSSTTLGSGVTASSLTSVGTITTGTWNAGAVTSSGTITGNASAASHPFSTGNQGSLFGGAGGSSTSPSTTNTNILFYNISSTNWAGIGSDGSGNVYVKTGTSGSPAAAFYITIAGALFAPLLTNTAQNEILCYSSSTGAITYAASVVGCTSSAMDTKNPKGWIDGAYALDFISKGIRPAIYTYKDTALYGTDEHPGLYADDVCMMDERLCARRPDGKVANYDKVGTLAYAIAAIKELKADNDNLREEVNSQKRVGVRHWWHH